MLYWIKLKSGELRYQDRVPKNRKYVSEEITRFPNQLTKHILRLNLNPGKYFHMLECRCGYDRGPKRLALIAKMLEITS